MLSSAEYHPYFEPYISKFNPKDFSIDKALSNSKEGLINQLEGIPALRQTHRYAPDKWTLKELLQHIIDTERVFQYRALSIARCDRQDLLGFDQDLFNSRAKANARELDALVTEFTVIRESTRLLYQSFDKEMLLRIGKASGNLISVRAIAYVIAGHTQHHLEVFQEKYG